MIPFLGALVVRALGLTIRFRHRGWERLQSQAIAAFWHAHILMMPHVRFRRPGKVLMSRSRDGDLAAAAMRYFDIGTIRGSSTRGGLGALREVIRAAKDGAIIGFTPDGPTGPPRVAKSGVVYAAQATGLPVVPVVFAAKKKSFCDRGTGWSCRCRSRERSLSTATRLPFHATATSKSGASAWRWK